MGVWIPGAPALPKKELGNPTLASLPDVMLIYGQSTIETQRGKAMKMYAVQGLDNLS